MQTVGVSKPQIDDHAPQVHAGTPAPLGFDNNKYINGLKKLVSALNSACTSACTQHVQCTCTRCKKKCDVTDVRGITKQANAVWTLINAKISYLWLGSEISHGKFPEIYSNLSGNLLNNFFHFIIFNYNQIKSLKISMFLTNNSPDLCVLT